MQSYTHLALVFVALCAIDWYRPDGTKVNDGAYVYPADMVEAVVKSQLAGSPGYSYVIRCEGT
jgi:hypothetical protein